MMPSGQFKHGAIGGQGWGIRTQVPCGHCTGCRQKKRDDWSIRCHHESKSYTNNSFITLTYDDAHLPADGSLHKPDLDRFINTLRKHRERADLPRFRYFGAGEYGKKNTLRPHYHLVLFGVWFDDAKKEQTKKENQVYTSETLHKLWGKGFCTIGNVEYATSAYVAKYCLERDRKSVV